MSVHYSEDSDFEIRSAHSDDLQAVARIFAHYVSNSAVTFHEDLPDMSYWTEKVIRKRAERYPFLVAVVDGVVAGYSFGQPWRPQSAYRRTVESSIYLSPAFGGLGIGRRLLSELLDRFVACGHQQVIAVIVDTGDQRSFALHAKAGFDQVGRLERVGRKFGREFDTILMQRTLVMPEPDASESDAISDRS